MAGGGGWGWVEFLKNYGVGKFKTGMSWLFMFTENSTGHTVFWGSVGVCDSKPVGDLVKSVRGEGAIDKFLGELDALCLLSVFEIIVGF